MLAVAVLAVGGFLAIGVVSNAMTAVPLDCGCKVRADRGCRSCDSGTCGNTCRACGKLRRPKTCPQCACDICLLELEHGKEKKTCFKTEQKLICVPPVRLPWQKCCPPGVSKTKTITVLKTHSYECPSCSYKWTVQEPVIAEPTSASKPAEANPSGQETVVPPATVPGQVTPPQPPFEGENSNATSRF